jgi:hypothetical protein
VKPALGAYVAPVKHFIDRGSYSHKQNTIPNVFQYDAAMVGADFIADIIIKMNAHKTHQQRHLQATRCYNISTNYM